MNKLLKIYKEKRFVPVFFTVLCGVIGFIIITGSNKVTFYLSIIIPFCILLVSGVFGIIKIFKRNYKTGILQLVLTGILGVWGLYMINFYLMFHPYDYYADSLEIPEGIEINIPKEETYAHHNPENNHFELYNYKQPGLYTYDLWLSKIDNGKVFLKVYEITKNDRLSEHRLTKESEVIVGHSKDIIQKYSTNNYFTIYEGDWGKPYAARFEVWYKNDKSNKEIKLLEKNYKIEGWQR